MIKKLVLLATVAAISACTSIPEDVKKAEPAPAVLDDNCASLAKYVRAIALSRDVGIAPQDAKIIARGTHTFPVDPIIKDVYKRRDLNPTASAINSYGVCVNLGYTKIVKLLVDAELTEQLTLNDEMLRLVKNISTLSADQPLMLRLDTNFTLPEPKAKRSR